MARKIEPTGEYFNTDLGCVVKVYPEKKVKRTLWKRGESFLGVKSRIQEDTGAMFATFSRKNGKY